MIRRSLRLSILLAGLLAASLTAQRPPQLTLGMGITDLWTNGGDPGAATTARGVALHTEAVVRYSRIAVAVDYTDGSLTSRGATSGDTHLVQGTVLARAYASPWFALEGGVRAERVSQTIEERWVHWVAGVRLDLPVIAGALRGHASYHHSLHTDVNFPRPGGSERYAEAGMTAMSPGGRIWTEVTGSSERSLSDAGSLREIEGVRLTVGVRLP